MQINTKKYGPVTVLKHLPVKPFSPPAGKRLVRIRAWGTEFWVREGDLATATGPAPCPKTAKRGIFGPTIHLLWI
jgi:hypothetical protein